MTVLVALVGSGYLADLLAGMAVNLQIAAIALGLGMALGLPLGLMQLGGRLQRSLVAPLIGLMRAAPTFVVMFFLLNVIPQDATLFGINLALSVPTDRRPVACPLCGRLCRRQWSRGAPDSSTRDSTDSGPALPAEHRTGVLRARHVVERRRGHRRERGRGRGLARSRTLAVP